jgi:hypothetical protein
MLKKSLLLAALVLLPLMTCGCLPLMIGSLGYQAYKYEKTGEIPGIPSKTARASTPRSSSTTSAPDPNEVE